MDTLMIVGIILFIAGFILIAVEMVVPGFGAPGISGIAWRKKSLELPQHSFPTVPVFLYQKY